MNPPTWTHPNYILHQNEEIHHRLSIKKKGKLHVSLSGCHSSPHHHGVELRWLPPRSFVGHITVSIQTLASNMFHKQLRRVFSTILNSHLTTDDALTWIRKPAGIKVVRLKNKISHVFLIKQISDPEVLQLKCFTNLIIFPSQKRRITKPNNLDHLSSHEVFMLLWWWAAIYFSFPLTLWVVIWSALCFYFAWREEGKSSKNSHQIKQLFTAGDVKITLT